MVLTAGVGRFWTLSALSARESCSEAKHWALCAMQRTHCQGCGVELNGETHTTADLWAPREPRYNNQIENPQIVDWTICECFEIQVRCSRLQIVKQRVRRFKRTAHCVWHNFFCDLSTSLRVSSNGKAPLWAQSHPQRCQVIPWQLACIHGLGGLAWFQSSTSVCICIYIYANLLSYESYV